MDARPVTRILRYVAPHRGTLMLAVTAAGVYALLDTAVYVLLIPFVEALFAAAASGPSSVSAIGALLDATVGPWIDPAGDPLAAVGRIIVVIVAVFLAKNAVLFARTYLMARVERGVARDLRDEAYGHLVGLDLDFFGRTRAGQVVSRLTTEVDRIGTLVTGEASRAVFAGLEFLVALAAMLLISWKLTLAAFVVVPAAMALQGPLVAVLRGRDRSAAHLAAEVTAHVQETLSGIRHVKAVSGEARERDRFGALNAASFRRLMRAERVRALAGPATEMLAAAGTVLLLWYGARLVVSGQLSGAELVGFLGLSMKLYAPVKRVAKLPATAQPGLVAAERVFELLDARPTVVERSDATPLTALTTGIAYEGVRFTYGGPGDAPALTDVSFEAPAGSVVALVGRSGSGKSTLVDLLPRLRDATAGRVCIDGVDVRDVRLADLRGLMGVVSQETILFHDTIRANVAYGRPDATDAEVEAAARAANAHAFIDRMPAGYATVVGERGVELSGGERQRIAIARALLRDPPILILDEATSALDSESERLIQGAIERLLEGRTVFVVAHRLSTVRRADLILVLDRGRIVERGDHDSLMAGSGIYRRLHELQLDGAATPGVV